MWAILLLFGLAVELNIEIGLLKHQRTFLQSQAPVTALTGGYGSGKSTSCALKGVYHTIQSPGVLHAVCSPSYPMAKLTLIPALFEVLEDWMELKEGRDFEYNRTDHYFETAWGGKLVVLSGENPKRLKGPNLGSFGIDEPGLQTHDVFKQARARVRHPQAKHPEIYLTGTPEDLNWYADLVEGNLKPSGLMDIRAHTRDNIFLPEEYFSSLEESYSEQEIKAYMAGQFVALNNAQAYHAYSTHNLIDREEFGDPDPSLPLLIGFDFNWSPNVGIIAQEVPDWKETENGEPGKKLIVFDELWFMNCSTERKCELLIERYGRDFQYLIYQDAAGKANNARTVGVSDLNLVRNSFGPTPDLPAINHNIYYPSANPRRIDRLNAVNGRLSNSKGHRFIYITKNCKHLIDDLRKTPRDEYLVGRFTDAERGHITDALGYLVHFRYPILRKVAHSNRRVRV